ncbi:MAG TPA: hypothetical protein VH877_05415 [Polyangia bacterium]|nr:hypothetical protein [Polyangia bacterium]
MADLDIEVADLDIEVGHLNNEVGDVVDSRPTPRRSRAHLEPFEV